MLVIEQCHPRHPRKRKPPMMHIYPSDPKKDELIGRLKASLEWSQRETQEHKIMMDQNALFRRVAELTNERNKLQGVYVELEVCRADLARAQELLKAHQQRGQQQEVHLPPAVIETPNQVTILEGYGKDAIYTYIDGVWVAES